MKQIRLVAVSVYLVLIFGGCLQPDGHANDQTEVRISVTGPISSQAVDEVIQSIRLVVTAPDIQPLAVDIDPDVGSTSISILAGPQRTFDLTVRGVLHEYRGQTVVDLDSGAQIDLPITVAVTRTFPEQLSLSPSRVFLTERSDVSVTATYVPADADVELNWSTADPTIALVDRSGTVTGLRIGTTELTVTNRDNGVSTTVAVTVGAVGVERWRYELGTNYTQFSIPSIDNNGTVYVGASGQVGEKGQLIAFGADGLPLWTITGPGDTYTSPAVDEDGNLFVVSIGSSESSLHKLSPDGDEIWSFTLPRRGRPYIPSVASSVHGGAIYVVTAGATFDIDEVVAVKPDGSGVLWTFTGLTENIGQKPSIAADGTLYVPGEDDFLYAVDHTTGTTSWSVDLRGSAFSSPAIGEDGTIYVGSYTGDTDVDGILHAIDPGGTESWSKTISGVGAGISSDPTIGLDGEIYFGSNNKAVYAIADNGGSYTDLWSYAVPDRAFECAAVGADGSLYVAGIYSEEAVIALEPTGSERWAIADFTGTGSTNTPSAVAVGPDGTIYVGTQNAFYAFNGNSGGPADTAWPTYGGSNRRLGR